MNDIEATGLIQMPAALPGSMSFKIPKQAKNQPDLPVTLTIGDLTVWRTTLTELRARLGPASVSQAKSLDMTLMQQPARSRLAVAARMMLRSQGEAFLDSEQTIQLTIGMPRTAAVGGAEALAGKGLDVQTATVLGRDLVDRLDLVPDLANRRLIDGEPRGSEVRDVTVVAYYLPQFYPFAVNDHAWGDGFTEWTNVLSATPQYAGHGMPLLPADLGFYDLRVADVRRRQADLAAQYGVDAFCYHYYWFSGRRVMQEGLDEILYSGEPSTNFCLCWANETWSRRWDGSESEVLVEQKHNPAIDATLIGDLLPYFSDERYLTVDGSPMLVIYRLGIMNEPEQVIAAWKAAAVAAGFPGLFVVAANTFGLTGEQAAWVDAVVEFPPHGSSARELQGELPTGSTTGATDFHNLASKQPAFEGKVYDYREVVVNAVCAVPTPYTCFPGIMPRWDNTPRRGHKSHSFMHSTPAAFQLWANLALTRAAGMAEGRRFLFINSWNEWAEGAMLEPDRHYGRAFLEALRQARSGYVISPETERRFRMISGLPDDGATQFLNNFDDAVTMVANMVTRMHSRQPARMQLGPPALVSFHKQVSAGGVGHLDYVSPGADLARILVQPGQVIDIVGWAMMDPTVPHVADRVSYLTLTDLATGEIACHYPVWSWRPRLDVRDVNHLNFSDEEACFGFQVKTAIDALPIGEYDLHMIQAVTGTLLRVGFGCRVVRI